MPDFCTCGAQLPEDARFCHKCGKPQRDEPVFIEEIPEEAAPPPPIVPPEPPPINLSNGPAVRAALPAAALAFALLAVTGPAGLLALFGGGFFAVYLYRRRTGQRLSMMNGARLGWIAGVFVFVIVVILGTLSFFALSEPQTLQEVRDQLVRRSARSEAEVTQALEWLRTPGGIVTALSFLFLSSTLLPAFGGALGAKFLDRS